MVKRAFSVREYVWDVVRDGPAMVIEVDQIDDAAVCPYVVVEVVNNAGRNKLGRVARRSERQLERYVKLLVPECEAKAQARRLNQDTLEGNESERLLKRLVTAMEKRGIEWSP